MITRLICLISIIPLLGASCFIPQRPHTFIPPTSEQGICNDNSNYFYSAIYKFCIIYPNDNWKRISVSLPIDILGTDITTFNFFSIQENFAIFTLYVAPVNDKNRTIYERELIPIVHKEPYLVGYTLNPDDRLPPDLQFLQVDVEEMTKSMIFN